MGGLIAKLYMEMEGHIIRVIGLNVIIYPSLI